MENQIEVENIEDETIEQEIFEEETELPSPDDAEGGDEGAEEDSTIEEPVEVSVEESPAVEIAQPVQSAAPVPPVVKEPKRIKKVIATAVINVDDATLTVMMNVVEDAVDGLKPLSWSKLALGDLQLTLENGLHDLAGKYALAVIEEEKKKTIRRTASKSSKPGKPAPKVTAAAKAESELDAMVANITGAPIAPKPAEPAAKAPALYATQPAAPVAKPAEVPAVKAGAPAPKAAAPTPKAAAPAPKAAAPVVKPAVVTPKKDLPAQKSLLDFFD